MPAGEPWNEDAVRAAIREIVADADEAFDPRGLWPAEEWDSWQTPVPLLSLYVGAAGVIWALDELRRRGHAETSIDLAAAALRSLELWRERPGLMGGIELPEHAEAAFLAGESGLLLAAWRVAGSDELARDLLARVRENATSDVNEVMWGAPGTLLATRAMWDRTGDERWAEAWRECAEEVWRRREPDGLWTQHLHGDTYRALDPVHGLVGNVMALLGGGELLPEERRETLQRETAAVLARTALPVEGLANWPAADGDDSATKLQWCTGAPGIVAAASSYLDEELLLAGAELTWRAGPPGAEKGSGLCHGTAGNGYAFLKAFERTGDESWLERARRFAVDALVQVAEARAERGCGRYSLWTGDVGVALFAAACLEGETAYPVME